MALNSEHVLFFPHCASSGLGRQIQLHTKKKHQNRSVPITDFVRLPIEDYKMRRGNAPSQESQTGIVGTSEYT
jgi:hypothetical protein